MNNCINTVSVTCCDQSYIIIAGSIIDLVLDVFECGGAAITQTPFLTNDSTFIDQTGVGIIELMPFKALGIFVHYKTDSSIGVNKDGGGSTVFTTFV